MILRAISTACAALAVPVSGPTFAQPDYVAAAGAAGARSVSVTPRPDGGVVLGGLLDGRQFALAIPKAWNHQPLTFVRRGLVRQL